MRKPMFALALVLVGLSACASPPAHTGSAAPPQPPAVSYVALGDSFTSGPLITAPVDGSPAGCLRSSANYPSYLASYLDVATLTDASCSGATTQDLYAARGEVPAQLAALSKSTDLVTVGIGGNDFNLFATMITTASLGGSTVTGMRDAAALQTRIAAALAAVRARAPTARIVVIGYLRVLPESGTCPFLRGSPAAVRAADRIERATNSSLERASSDAGATFIDAYALSAGHDVCAGAQAWVNGSTTDVSGAAPFHPFRAGMDAIARAIVPVVSKPPIAETPSAAALLRVPR